MNKNNPQTPCAALPAFHINLAADDHRLVRHESFDIAHQEAIRLANVTGKPIYQLVAVQRVEAMKPFPRYFVAKATKFKSGWAKVGLMFVEVEDLNIAPVGYHTNGTTSRAKNTIYTILDHVEKGRWEEITRAQAAQLQKNALDMLNTSKDVPASAPQTAPLFPQYFTHVSGFTRTPNPTAFWIFISSKSGIVINKAGQNAGDLDEHDYQNAINNVRNGLWKLIGENDARLLLDKKPAVTEAPEPEPSKVSKFLHAAIEPKYPRYFEHQDGGFINRGVYAFFASANTACMVGSDGSHIRNSSWSQKHADKWVQEGIWKEITAAEASALLAKAAASLN